MPPQSVQLMTRATVFLLPDVFPFLCESICRNGFLIVFEIQNKTIAQEKHGEYRKYRNLQLMIPHNKEVKILTETSLKHDKHHAGTHQVVILIRKIGSKNIERYRME